MARNTRSAAAENLRPVPELETDVDVVGELADEVEYRTVVARLEPETNLVGLLMRLPAAEVAEVLELLHDDDVERPLARAILTVIRMLVAEGRAPDPVAVVTAVRNPDRRAEITEEGTVLEDLPGRFETIARHVVDCYTTGINVNLWGTVFQVVDNAYRRSMGMAGMRLSQMADYPADTQDMEKVVVGGLDDWRDYWRRKRAISSRYNAAPPADPEPADPAPEGLDDEPAPEPEN